MEKLNFISVLCLLLVTYLFGKINTESTFLVKKEEFENKIIPGYILKQINNTETLTKCVYHCFHNLGCVSIFYNTNQRNCQMNSVMFISPEDGVEDIGSSYFTLSQEGCPVDFIRNRKLDMCYKPITTSVEDFDEAKDACAVNGYVLVRGKTVEAYSHISDQLLASSGYGHGKFIIDGNDADVEGVWRFANGDNMTAFVWAEGEPDNRAPEKDFVYLKDSGGVYEMSDTAFGLDGYYICQLL